MYFSSHVLVPTQLTARNDDPEPIHQNIVSPEVVRLWSRVADVIAVVIEDAGRVVKHVAVELAE